MTELGRLRWRCRRGMLELDLALDRFLERYGAALSADQRATFEEVLDYPDNDLWDCICKRQRAPDARHQAVIDLL
ncbi:MAG TPA: succinate dehydrogenase assembly factor 2 [Burkholderiales bacterium]|jgi:antitoxin CptB|nr:succinate dehydrogenase assembly factor 2 [Burkholderiales bacterium]